MKHRHVKQLGLIAAVLLSALASAYSGAINSYYLQVIIFVGINITLAVSLNLINGYTGQFSLGHAGFMAIGAYVSAYLSTEQSAGVFNVARRRRRLQHRRRSFSARSCSAESRPRSRASRSAFPRFA